MGVGSPSYFINHIIKNKKNMKNSIIVPFDLNTARKIKRYKYECLGGLRYKECIPYQGNEHLLGTNKSK